MDKKRLVSLFLVLFMVVTLLPLPASAEEDVLLPQSVGPVSVAFLGEGIELSYVTLLDEAGNTVLPLSDAGGLYLLAPGAYSYYYLDPTGLTENLPVTALILDGTEQRVEIPLTATPVQTEAEAETFFQAPPEATAEAQIIAETERMPVTFRCASALDYAGLTVINAVGVVMQPYVDPASGIPQPENYLLFPGQYSYRFHDFSERFSDTEGSFLVTGTGMQIITLEPQDEQGGMCFSATAVNPYYANVIGEDAIPAPSTTPEESLEQLRLEVESLSTTYAAPSSAEGETWPTPVIYDNAEAAGASIKRSLIIRKKEIAICVRSNIKPTAEVWQKMCWMMYDIAIRHSGAPTEGDYLRYEYGGVNCNGSAVSAKKEGEYYYKFIYSPLYFTTVGQESELSSRVGSILESLRLNGKSNEEKVRTVYQYLCDHVHYQDSSSTLMFTAYNALVNGTAACQGIAVAFYRLCLELGVDARVVTSQEMGHAWNIVSVDGRRYYALDATWDAGKRPEQWSYYLKGRGSWLSEHALGDEFTEGKFSGYDFPNEDYGAPSSVQIHSASLLFDGMLRIKYYFLIPEALLNTRGAVAQFSVDGSVRLTTPLQDARPEGEYACFYYSVSAEEIDTPVQLRILDGGGNNVLISTVGGTSYPNGVFLSAMEYAQKMKSTASSATMRALAQALEDYGLAAKNYFRKSGLSLRPEVTAVTAAELSAWDIVTQGQKPAGVRNAAISVVFEADNSLRVYLNFEAGVDPNEYRYEIDGRAASLRRRSDGNYYLTVENIAADELDTAHRFTVSGASGSYTITASVLGYAKTAIERGEGDMANLAKALYLYNRAAESYFGS